MPIAVQCACGKSFVVDEEYRGRRMPCPDCGAQLSIGGAAKKSGSATAHPTPRSRSAPGGAKGVSFSISPKIIILGVLIILIPATIVIVKLGPVRATAQWHDMAPQAELDINDVLIQGMRNKMASLGIVSRSSAQEPEVSGLVLDEPHIMWSLPEKIGFQARNTRSLVAGFGANGKPQLINIHGFYYTKTGMVEAEIESYLGQPLSVRGRVVDKIVKMEP